MQGFCLGSYQQDSESSIPCLIINITGSLGWIIISIQ